VHVDRMRKLPISLDVEPSVESSDSHTYTRENNESTIPSRKRRRTQPATDMSSIHSTESANRGDRVDSVSPLDKATDNLLTAIKTAAECVPNNLDTCQVREQACQSTGDAAGAATGPGNRPRLTNTGRPKRSR